MTYTTAALVGATGGAGTTRTTLEIAVVLAADGADVAVLDAAYATQGLGGYLSGRLDPDLTSLVTDRPETPLSAGLVEFETGGAGSVACCPADAPFERLARAKTVESARRFEARIEEAATAFDHVLVDVPPLASNPAVAAATGCERVGLVAPDGDRGRDATARLRERLADVGTGADVHVVTRGDADEPGVDVVLPGTEASAPACLTDERYGRSVASLAALLVERDVGDAVASDGLLGGVGEMIRRR
ncbi:ParA family protein [Salinigranum salinum]|uniref:ParA family protein n=1 Tax=Salinigranum salinum TaxID=1364937 RepID=UPI0012611AC2|nr:ParA family protein [Salinigranum salinum]